MANVLFQLKKKKLAVFSLKSKFGQKDPFKMAFMVWNFPPQYKISHLSKVFWFHLVENDS